jgi:hypothetical protein
MCGTGLSLFWAIGFGEVQRLWSKGRHVAEFQLVLAHNRCGAAIAQTGLDSDQIKRLAPRLRTIGLGCREAPPSVPAAARFRNPDLQHDPSCLPEIPQHVNAMIECEWAVTVLPSAWNITGASAAAIFRNNSSSSSVRSQPRQESESERPRIADA